MHSCDAQEIDADGDGQVDFQEFCSYFGRPNVSYSRALPRKDGPNGLSRMPMKQHVRIMGGQGKSIETSMEAIRKSMPAGKNDAAPMASIKKGEIEPTGDESIGKKAQSAPELPDQEKAKKMTVQETEKSKKKAAATTRKILDSRCWSASGWLSKLRSLFGTLNNRCRTIIGTQRGTIILTTTQANIRLLPSVVAPFL